MEGRENQPNLIQSIKFTLHASSKNFYVNENHENQQISHRNRSTLNLTSLHDSDRAKERFGQRINLIRP